jgi:hypothetical protein
MDPSPRATNHPRRRRTLAAVAAASASVAGVGGLAYALAAGGVSVSPTAVTSPGSASGGAAVLAAGGTPPAQPRGRHGLRGLVRRAVHVDVVVPKAGGGFRTIDIDRGAVTAVSSTSITVTSPGRTPVTAAITSSTRQPAGAVTVSEQVVLVSSDGNALLVRPVRTAASGTGSATGANPGTGNSGTANSGTANSGIGTSGPSGTGYTGVTLS